MSPRKLLVLPGSGSPLSKRYEPVFSLIVDGGKSRGWDVEVLTYLGAGQGDDPGSGLTQQGALDAVKAQLLSAPVGSRLLARSFGCTVALSALRELDGLAARFETVALWGPGSWSTYWHWFVRPSCLGIEDFNYVARRDESGVVLSSEFVATMEPVEWLIANQPPAPHLRYRIGTGTKDPDSHPAFARLLRDTVSHGGPAEMVEVPGAAHSVKPSDPPEVVAAFLEFVFG